jgi:SPP1 gp7 family putative phage head morphogenesis protein
MQQTADWIVELCEVIALLESNIPANPASEPNDKLARRFEKVMAAYFEGLDNAFPYHKLETIYYRNIVQEVAKSPLFEGEEFLDPLLSAFRSDLLYRMNGHIASVYIAGSAQMISWGKTKLAELPIVYEGPPIRQAIEYAEKRCAELVTKMDEETKSKLAQIISDGINDKRGVDGLARDIRNEFADMSKTRAEMIARTETADALEQSFMDRSKDMGIEYKEWIVNNPCPICEENGNEGVVPLAHEFSSGHVRPPAHPRCVCALAPARLPRG